MEIIKNKLYTREDLKIELNLGNEVVQGIFNDPRLETIGITRKEFVLGSRLLGYFENLSDTGGGIISTRGNKNYG